MPKPASGPQTSGKLYHLQFSEGELRDLLSLLDWVRGNSRDDPQLNIAEFWAARIRAQAEGQGFAE